MREGVSHLHGLGHEEHTIASETHEVRQTAEMTNIAATVVGVSP